MINNIDSGSTLRRKLRSGRQVRNDKSMKIYYITGNKYKLQHAEEYVRGSGIQVIGKELYISEIQSHDIEEVVRRKASDAWEIMKEPLIVSDSGWEIPALNGFPGPYMKDVNEWLGAEDFLNLMRNKQDRSIYLNHYIAVVIAGKSKIFKERARGIFVDEPQGVGSALDRVVMMDGSDCTIALNQEKVMFSADGAPIWQEVIEYLKNEDL